MNRIKELREKKGLSQDKLAKQLAVNLRTLQRWENDETAIRKKNAKKLADYFDVSESYLLGYSDIKNLKEMEHHFLPEEHIEANEEERQKIYQLIEEEKSELENLNLVSSCALASYHIKQLLDILLDIQGASLAKYENKKLRKKDLIAISELSKEIDGNKSEVYNMLAQASEILKMISLKS